MTILEARIRRRLKRPCQVQVFYDGEEQFGSDENVVKMRRTATGVRLWCLWSNLRDDVETDMEVAEYWYPVIDELRVMRYE